MLPELVHGIVVPMAHGGLWTVALVLREVEETEVHAVEVVEPAQVGAELLVAGVRQQLLALWLLLLPRGQSLVS